MRKALVLLLLLFLVACGDRVQETGPFVERSASDRTESSPETEQSDIPAIVAQGRFTGAAHAGEGAAEIVERGGKRTLQLRGFRTDPGPDLKVWLATDTQASDHVSLGDLQEFDGDQAYEVSSQTDLQQYSYVLIWCEEFSVLFASAKLETLFNP